VRRVTNAEDHARGRCELLNLTTDVIERLVALNSQDEETIRRLRMKLVDLIVGRAKAKAD
jgi:hypothetical protein